MKEIELIGACTLDGALYKLKKEALKADEPCFAEFNGSIICSEDSIDDAYMRVTGMSKAEHDAKRKMKIEEDLRKIAEHKKNMPIICEQYRKEARGLIREDTLDIWDSIVEIRVGDIYRGMEMRNTLDCCRAMRDSSKTLEQRLRAAYKIFFDAGHSGMSAALTMALLRKFCPDGEELAIACAEYRYKEGRELSDK